MSLNIQSKIDEIVGVLHLCKKGYSERDIQTLTTLFNDLKLSMQIDMANLSPDCEFKVIHINTDHATSLHKTLDDAKQSVDEQGGYIYFQGSRKGRKLICKKNKQTGGKWKNYTFR